MDGLQEGCESDTKNPPPHLFPVALTIVFVKNILYVKLYLLRYCFTSNMRRMAWDATLYIHSSNIQSSLSLRYDVQNNFQDTRM